MGPKYKNQYALLHRKIKIVILNILDMHNAYIIVVIFNMKQNGDIYEQDVLRDSIVVGTAKISCTYNVNMCCCVSIFEEKKQPLD